MERDRRAYKLACDLWNRVGLQHGVKDWYWGRVEQIASERFAKVRAQRDDAKAKLETLEEENRELKQLIRDAPKGLGAYEDGE